VAKPQPKRAKRLECAELAPVFAPLHLATAPASWTHSKRFAWQFIHKNRLALGLPLALALGLLSQSAGAQESSSSATLPWNRYRNGEETLRAFAPISEATTVVCPNGVTAQSHPKSRHEDATINAWHG